MLLISTFQCDVVELPTLAATYMLSTSILVMAIISYCFLCRVRNAPAAGISPLSRSFASTATTVLPVVNPLKGYHPLNRSSFRLSSGTPHNMTFL